MIRFLLLSILLTLLFRAVSRLWSGVVRGTDRQGHPGGSSGVPTRGVHMERDPTCGTFVVPERAVALSTSGGNRLFFCSTDCRDKYCNRPEASPADAHGRTA